MMLALSAICLIILISFLASRKDSSKGTNSTVSNDAAKVTSSADPSTKEYVREPSPEIFIKYVDAEGHETTRGISNLKYSNRWHFDAYCHLRKEIRTFNVDRILEACDADTGEPLQRITAKWGPNGRTRSYEL